MESAREIIEKLVGIEVGITCAKCGAVVSMVGKQYTARCHACGTNITVSMERLARQKQFEYRDKYGDLKVPVRCTFCQDTGAVILEEQVDDQLAKYVYRCICQAGQRRPEAWPVVPAAKIMAFTPHLRLVQPEDAE